MRLPLPDASAAALFYAGVLVGVSFIATPAKFLAEDVPLSGLLLVGRVTFGVFAWVEFVLAAIFIACTWTGRGYLLWPALVVVAVLVQHLILRQLLDERVSETVAGSISEPSGWHRTYVVIEIIKLGALFAASCEAHKKDSCTSIEGSPHAETA